MNAAAPHRCRDHDPGSIPGALLPFLTVDTYFKVNYLGHNLVRTRCQLTLAKDVLRKKDELDWIVEKTPNYD